MRKVKVYLLSLVSGITLLGTTCAFASGYPFAALVGGASPAIVIGKIFSGSGQFTQAEAQKLGTSVPNLALSLLSSGGISTLPTATYSPSQLIGFGGAYADADSLVNLVKPNYVAWGYKLYVVVYVTKVPQYAPGFGQNMRLDVYIADYASLVGVQAAYLYAASLEVPYLFMSLLP